MHKYIHPYGQVQYPYVKVNISLCKSTYILMYKYIYPYVQVQYPYEKVNKSLCKSAYILTYNCISLCTST